MAYEWIALFRALFDLLDHDWVWKTDPSQKRQWVQDIQFQLECELPEKVIEKTVTKNSVKTAIYAMAYEEILAMFDFDIEDYIRVTPEGLLQLNIDGCSDCNWTTVWDLNGGAVSGTYDKILDSAGNLIDNAFAGITSGANLPQKTGQDEDLARCAKATAYAEIVWGYLAAFAEAYATLSIGGIDSDDFNLLSVANSVLGIFAEALKFAPGLTPFLGVAEIGGVVLAVSQQLEQELTEFVENETNKQKLICFYHKAFTQRESLVGEDVSRALTRLDNAAMGVSAEFLEVIKKIMRSLPTRETSQAVNAARVSNDCGCPEVNNAIDPIATPPELAEWYAIADFKTHQPSYYGFSTDYGDWVSGEGLNGNYDGNMTRNFAFIFMGASGTAIVERIDVSLENVVRGQFFSGEGTPDNDIEGFYCRYRFYGGVPLAVKPIAMPVTSILVGSKATQITLQFMFGYEERDPNTIPDQTGFGTITQVKVWGRGTVPSEYNTWAVTSV